MTTVINIAAYALLALAGIVILGIALLAIITTVVNFFQVLQVPRTRRRISQPRRGFGPAIKRTRHERKHILFR